MIQAKDLRIGNWVQIKYPEGSVGEGQEPFDVVEHIQQTKLYCRKDRHWGPIEEYFPIALTSEILDRCGFEKLPGTRAMFRIFVDELELTVSTELFYFYINTAWGQAPIKNPICKYLHQLQNLYWCLVGEELKINL